MCIFWNAKCTQARKRPRAAHLSRLGRTRRLVSRHLQSSYSCGEGLKARGAVSVQSTRWGAPRRCRRTMVAAFLLFPALQIAAVPVATAGGGPCALNRDRADTVQSRPAKTKEENPKHAQRELDTIHAADYTAVLSCCEVCDRDMGVVSRDFAEVGCAGGLAPWARRKEAAKWSPEPKK